MPEPARIGSYRIERLLGVGSFATVWLGADDTLGARVAIKVLAENWSHDLRVRERFLDEARLLWRIDDARVIRVHAVGELADGRPYFVMAWAEGGSLRDRLNAGRPPARRALWLLHEIAAAVAVLHEHGIVHRDLSPGNVLFRRTGDVLIADLGLAKALAAASGLTARAGTPGYMAPEQDEPLSVVDARTDVFGLGRLGAALLCAAPAPGGTRPGVLRPLRPAVPAKVADVLRRATAPRPADRFADAAAFLAALDRATAPGRVRPALVAAGRWWPATVAAALVAAAVLAGAAASGPAVVRTPQGRVVAHDATGRLTVALPPGWRLRGTGWHDPPSTTNPSATSTATSTGANPADASRATNGGSGGSDGSDGSVRRPGLVMSPDPRRWAVDPRLPGAFVGLPGTRGQTPLQFVEARVHPRCRAAERRIVRRGGLDWTVAAHDGCADGKPAVVEAAAAAPAGDGLVYAQITPPAGAGPEFVDGLLADVRVRW